MQILVYSETTSVTVAGNLGNPEYSYYFILEKYLPLLCDLGEVVCVEEPGREVDALYDEALARGEPVVFLSFTPPHRTAIGLRCPTVCVLAWEFDCIPYETWDPQEPWNNWVAAIRKIGNVLTISDYATRVIRRQVGRGPRVATIPAPVTAGEMDLPALKGRASRGGGANTRSLDITASVIDTRALDIDTERVTPRLYDPDQPEYRQPPWDGHRVEWDFSSASKGAGEYLVGFYGEEPWGRWSKTAHPSVVLPWSVCGELRLTLELQGYGLNQGREIGVMIGDQRVGLVLASELETHELAFALERPANSIQFADIVAISAPGARDHRTLGVGLARLVLCRPGGDAATPAADEAAVTDEITPEAATALRFTGAVYTSIFNPADGRKNWHDIVTAFCWAFRDDPDKSLVLKMSHHNRSTFLGELLLLFSRLSPFRCRIVAIHGYLTQEEMAALVAVTDYFVNASLAEGQCLPLLEFMAQGVPALAPHHTAMETYIRPDNAFVVASSPQPHIWPADPRRAYRTRDNRISWDSLWRAYRDSAALLADAPERYATMSRSAAETVARHYSRQKIERELGTFLDRTARSRGWRRWLPW